MATGRKDFANGVGKREVLAMLWGEGALRSLSGPALMNSRFLLREQEGAPSLEHSSLLSTGFCLG